MAAKRFNDGRDWFFEARYGMFIHWGLYSIDGRHEQIWWRKKWDPADYVKLAEQFNPTKFDPEQWLDLAEAAGMKYLCITTKHHDGFCLWDTAHTDFNVMNTPYGWDICGMLAEACQKRGIPLCWYYSAVDWHQPNYPNLGRSHELDAPKPGDAPDLDAYLEFVKNQIRELCGNYGPIHGFWWDMNVTERTDPSVNDLIRSLQPDCIINNRGFDDGDYGTPERDFDHDSAGEAVFSQIIESCNSVGVDSWSFRFDEDYYTDRYLQQAMATTFAKGGNYLLNVGPDATGVIRPEYGDILRRIGDWLGRVGEAFDDTSAVQMPDAENALITRRDNTLYVIHAAQPSTDRVWLAPIPIEPTTATLLNTGESIATQVHWLPQRFWRVGDAEYLSLRQLPVNALTGDVMVMKLEFDEIDDAWFGVKSGKTEVTRSPFGE